MSLKYKIGDRFKLTIGELKGLEIEIEREFKEANQHFYSIKITNRPMLLWMPCMTITEKYLDLNKTREDTSNVGYI